MDSKNKGNKVIFAVLLIEFVFLLGWCYIKSEHKSYAAAQASAETASIDVSSSPSAVGTVQQGDQLLIPNSSQIKAPDFELPNVSTGQNIRLSTELKSHPVVFTFWATWCPPCQAELPVLEEISHKYQGRVAFYGINFSDDAPTIRSFLNTHNYTMPMLSDSSSEAGNAYSVSTIPRLFIVGTDGKIKCDIDGYSDEEGPDLERVIDDVLRQQG